MTMTMNPLAAMNTPAAPTLAVGSATVAANATKAVAPALPFAPLLKTKDEAPAMSLPKPGEASDETSDAVPDDAPVDVLDTALMQALDEMLSRGPSKKATAVAADGDVPVDAVDDERSAAMPAVTPTPILAMLMPTAIPAPIPAAMPAASASRSVPVSTASSDVAGATASSSQAASKSALTTDLASLLAIPGSDAVSMPADVPAWQGLPRWSADLMTAMALAGPASSANAIGAAFADGGDAMGSTLTLPAAREAWQQPLMQALGDRLQLQIAQRADSARLHLEPPQLGRIEIDIRQQGGALQVQLSASNDDVRQQLRQIAEPLRHELVQRHAGEVSVQVASGAQAAGDGRGRDGAAAGGQPQSNGQQRDAQRQPGRALHDEDQSAASSSPVVGFADALAGSAGGSTAGSTGVVGLMSGNTRTPR
ncbi:flagellar hook-length control protein FliK [Roseateles chitinivorans]|uniref:flagellar hook-length control protein FliK n=1 Tax=Roseateles chitinivorans TaxID=2917965 RepID=UPI003D66D82A